MYSKETSSTVAFKSRTKKVNKHVCFDVPGIYDTLKLAQTFEHSSASNPEIQRWVSVSSFDTAMGFVKVLTKKAENKRNNGFVFMLGPSETRVLKKMGRNQICKIIHRALLLIDLGQRIVEKLCLPARFY